jgi:hypothetical protein
MTEFVKGVIALLDLLADGDLAALAQAIGEELERRTRQ